MANLQELSDRLEINDLLIRYTYAIDDGDWELLDRVFTPDAQIDYTSSGGIAGRSLGCDSASELPLASPLPSDPIIQSDSPTLGLHLTRHASKRQHQIQ